MQLDPIDPTLQIYFPSLHILEHLQSQFIQNRLKKRAFKSYNELQVVQVWHVLYTISSWEIISLAVTTIMPCPPCLLEAGNIKEFHELLIKHPNLCSSKTTVLIKN
jgi:hypothetical protein